ncbi:VacJ family lipoprotein [uncultured Paraglaciecola sp.]|uniref:MlaA family lipoprotein n=1 Tax=uncultured Paraglaciecola sp. TaxID=1765024 RepID=UPI0030D79EF6|tara:strand:+ start:43908 stop:44810 length:903 start_codon:yes stop_codon:yes gene_type:complete
MDLNRGKWSSLVLLVILTLLAGCASKNQLEQGQSQLFQTGVSREQDQPVIKSEAAIEVKTSNGVVAITPTVVGYSETQFDDPFESINRPIFAVNHVVYTWVLNPLAKGYTAIMPDPAEVAVSQFFSNLREPLNAINHLLQANGKKMGSSLGRFIINSTLGVLGIFDPANAWFEIKPHRATLNDTLTTWDVGYGAYIVLPILGQSDVRNGVSTLTESTFAPVTFVSEPPQTQYIQAYDGFHEFSPRASSYETLYKESDDPYVFFRNMYMQSLLRDKEYQNYQEKTPEPSDPTVTVEGQTHD